MIRSGLFGCKSPVGVPSGSGGCSRDNSGWENEGNSAEDPTIGDVAASAKSWDISGGGTEYGILGIGRGSSSEGDEREEENNRPKSVEERDRRLVPAGDALPSDDDEPDCQALGGGPGITIGANPLCLGKRFSPDEELCPWDD